ncbi:hypothetical protein [Flagellimonas sp.]|uniref:hypothetical protein n=1 Tax=Flagellimonas sp. TaxID=2058762 RepID=UPI003B522008
MRTILFCAILLQSPFALSQNSIEQKRLKEDLEKEKLELNQRLKSIEKEIDSIEQEISFSKAKERGIKSTMKRGSELRKSPKYNSQIIATPDRNEEIIIINKYKYGTYYYAIFKEKIGYIKQKDVRQKKEFIHLSTVEPPSTSSSQRKNYTRSYTPRKTYSRRYYRGPRGGCYYINSNGNKTYVARSLCN